MSQNILSIGFEIEPSNFLTELESVRDVLKEIENTINNIEDFDIDDLQEKISGLKIGTKGVSTTLQAGAEELPRTWKGLAKMRMKDILEYPFKEQATTGKSQMEMLLGVLGESLKAEEGDVEKVESTKIAGLLKGLVSSQSRLMEMTSGMGDITAEEFRTATGGRRTDISKQLNMLVYYSNIMKASAIREKARLGEAGYTEESQTELLQRMGQFGEYSVREAAMVGGEKAGAETRWDIASLAEGGKSLMLGESKVRTTLTEMNKVYPQILGQLKILGKELIGIEKEGIGGKKTEKFMQSFFARDPLQREKVEPILLKWMERALSFITAKMTPKKLIEKLVTEKAILPRFFAYSEEKKGEKEIIQERLEQVANEFKFSPELIKTKRIPGGGLFKDIDEEKFMKLMEDLPSHYEKIKNSLKEGNDDIKGILGLIYGKIASSQRGSKFEVRKGRPI